MNASLFLSQWGKRLAKKMIKNRGKYKPDDTTNRWNIVRGDFVQVIQGPQTGQKGKILSVIRKNSRLIIEGVNMRYRNIKPQSDGMPGKRIIRPCSIHYSNVMLIDPSTGLPTKVSRKYLEDGTKIRVARSTGVEIPKPHPLFDRKPRSIAVGSKDTSSNDVFKVTFPDYSKYMSYIYASKKGQKNSPN